MGKLNIKNQIQDILDNTELDDKLVKELDALKTKAEQIENKLEAHTDKILIKPKSLLKRLKSTFGFWSIIEIGLLLFMVIPALSGDYNISFGFSIAYLLMHKFNLNWIK